MASLRRSFLDDGEERCTNKRRKPAATADLRLPSVVLASFSVEQEEGMAVYTPRFDFSIFSPRWSLPSPAGFQVPSTPRFNWDAQLEVWCSSEAQPSAASGASSHSPCDSAAESCPGLPIVERCELEMVQDQHAAYELIYKDLEDMIGSSPCPATEAENSFISKGDSSSAWSDVGQFLEDGQCSDAHTPESAAAFPVEEEPEQEEAKEEEEENLAFNSVEELTEMLLESGEALVADDGHRASAMVARIQRHSTPEGTHLQRVAHYFALALVARLNATGADLYSAIRRRDQAAVVEAERVYNGAADPTAAVAQRFGTSVLLSALEGAERVHIVDYGAGVAEQWPALMRALAHRARGPPQLLRITGVEQAGQGSNPPAGAGARETGRRLARVAAGLGIPFQYKAIARTRWEAVHAADLGLRDDEVLAVSCTFRLRNLLDDSVVLSNPRRTVLERICSMRPRVLLTAEPSLAGNAPFLVARLREAIPSCHSFFQAIDATMPRDCTARRIVEEEILGRDVLNMVACEGADRVERPEAYHQWHRRLLNAGFRQLPLDDARFADTREVLAGYHDDWTIGRDEGWLLTGWNGRVHHAYAAWTPADVT